MAYGVIYKLRAETAKYKSDVKINILKNGYAGTSYDKYLGAGGVTLIKDSAGVICGTSLSFTIQADTDFEYLSFFESAPREYLVQLLIDNVIVWQGYLIGDEYREAFRNPPYDVAVTATDGLGLLKNYDYTVLSTPTTKTTRIDVVREILEKTGLNIAISVSYDVVTGATKFFNVAFADDYFADWTCYDVLEKMIPPDATITQHAGKWLIRRNEQDTAKTHTIYNYVEGLGYVITNGVGETALDLAAMGEGDVYPIGQAELNMQHAWNTLTVTSEHGKRPSFLYNHDFADGLTNWTEGSPTGVAVAYDSDNGSYVLMEGSYAYNSEDVPDAYIKQCFPYTSVDGEGFLISFKYSMTGWILFGIGGLRPVMLTFKGRVEITDGVDTYYLDETDGWSTTNRNFEKKDTTVISGFEWKEMAIFAENPPIASGTVTVYLYPLTTVVDNPSIAFTDIVVHPFVWKNYPNAYTYAVTLQENATEKAEVTILPTSAPDVNNYDRMFYNGHSVSDARVDSFTSGGNTYTYTNLILNSLKFLHGTTRQLLSGYFRGAGLSLNCLINCAATAGREYVVESGAWEILNDKFDLNLLEIPGSASGSSWAVGTTDFAMSAEWSDNHTAGGGGSSSVGGGGIYTGGGGSWLDQYFEIVNPGTSGEYIRALRDFASTGEITAYNTNDITGTAPVASFFDLSDVSPTGFDGASGHYVKVNDAGTALEFASGTPGGVCDFSGVTITGTTYNLADTDAGKYLRFTSASSVLVTVPLDSTATFTQWGVVTMFQAGDGVVTITGETTGVTINAYDSGYSSAGKYWGMQLINVDTDNWDLIAGV